MRYFSHYQKNYKTTKINSSAVTRLKAMCYFHPLTVCMCVCWSLAECMCYAMRVSMRAPGSHMATFRPISFPHLMTERGPGSSLILSTSGCSTESIFTHNPIYQRLQTNCKYPMLVALLLHMIVSCWVGKQQKMVGGIPLWCKMCVAIISFGLVWRIREILSFGFWLK